MGVAFPDKPYPYRKWLGVTPALPILKGLPCTYAYTLYCITTIFDAVIPGLSKRVLKNPFLEFKKKHKNLKKSKFYLFGFKKQKSIQKSEFSFLKSFFQLCK